LDVENGYLQWALKERFKYFCVFGVGEAIYHFRVMPFGLKAVPWDFSCVVKWVVALFRKQGIRCTLYIDDLFFLAESEGEALGFRTKVLGVLHRLGLRVSIKKCLLCPGNSCTTWALIYVCWIARCGFHRRKSFPFKNVAQLLHSRCQASGGPLARVIGKLGSFRVGCTGAVVLTRGLMRFLDQLPLVQRGRVGCSGEVAVWGWTIRGTWTLSPLAVTELRFWLAAIQRLNGMCMNSAVQVVAFVDACPEGYGSVLAEMSRTLRSGQLWSTRFEAKSTQFELQNLVRVCMEHGELHRGYLIHVCTDNVGAAFIAGKGCKLVRWIFSYGWSTYSSILQ
jgi:hypothetical protein